MKPQREGGGLVHPNFDLPTALLLFKNKERGEETYLTNPPNYFSGNNIYGDDVRETLLKLQKADSQEDAAYILMQRIFPSISATVLLRNGCWHKDHAISELGIFGTYLRYIDWPNVYNS